MKRTIAVGAAALAGMAISCHLDLSGKTACESQVDCFDGYICQAKRCVMPEDRPAAPSDVTAVPRPDGLELSWSPVANAAGYIVDIQPFPDLPPEFHKTVAVVMPPVTVPTDDRMNRYRVAAVNPRGKSELSAPVCGFASPSDHTGLTLHDPLCDGTLDGARWVGTGSTSGNIQIDTFRGSALMSVAMRNQPPRSRDNAIFSAFATAYTDRPVTAIAGDVTIPTAVAGDGFPPRPLTSRTGDSSVLAALRLLYQPVAQRKTFPGANRDLLLVEVGLIDDGHGLQAYRQASHCDNPACSRISDGGVAFVDPAGWVVSDRRATSPAYYDVTYHLSVALDPDGHRFRFTFSGGGFGSGVSATADVSGYVSSWSGVTLGSGGFFMAQMGVSTFDDLEAGGGSGAVTARFDNLAIDFEGASGVQPLWINGNQVHAMEFGRFILEDSFLLGPGPAPAPADGLQLVEATPINTLQADVELEYSREGSAVQLQGRFYNDGSDGTVAPDRNGSGSAVGDILASVYLAATGDEAPNGDEILSAGYFVVRCKTAICADPTEPISSGTLTKALGPGVHTPRLSWDPAAQRFTFSVDGAYQQTVDPTAAAPVHGPPNAPLKRIVTTGVNLTHAAVANVFTAP